MSGQITLPKGNPPVFCFVAEQGSIPAFILPKQGHTMGWRGACLGLIFRKARKNELCVASDLIDYCAGVELFESLYLAQTYLVERHGEQVLGYVLDFDQTSKNFCSRNQLLIEGDSFSLNFLFGFSLCLKGRKWCQGLYVTGAVRPTRTLRCGRVGQIRQKARMFHALEGRVFMVPRSNCRELERAGLLSDKIQVMPPDLDECMAIFESCTDCFDRSEYER